MPTKRNAETSLGSIPLSPKNRARMAKLYGEVLSRIEKMAEISANTVGKSTKFAGSTTLAEVSLRRTRKSSAQSPIFQIGAAAADKALRAAAKSRPYVYGYSPDGY